MQAVKWLVAKLQGGKTAYFCGKMSGGKLQGDKAAPPSSMVLFDPWISGPLRVSWLYWLFLQVWPLEGGMCKTMCTPEGEVRFVQPLWRYLDVVVCCCMTLDGQICQLPIASIQRMRSFLSSHLRNATWHECYTNECESHDSTRNAM